MLSKFTPPSLLLLHQTLSVSSPTAPLCGTGSPPPLCGLTLVLNCNNFLAPVRSLPSQDPQKPASQGTYLSVSISQYRALPWELGYVWGYLLLCGGSIWLARDWATLHPDAMVGRFLCIDRLAAGGH
jgi:hypothetical protein